MMACFFTAGREIVNPKLSFPDANTPSATAANVDAAPVSRKKRRPGGSVIHRRAFAILFVLLAGAPAAAQESFTVSVRGQAILDAGYVGQGKNPAGLDYNSGANLRRAQLTVSGDLAKGWRYSASGIYTSRGSQTGSRFSGYVEYQGENSLGLRAGVFSAPSGIAGNTNAVSELMLERPSPVTIARTIAAGPTRATFTGFAQGPRHLVAVSFTGGSVGAGGSYDDQQAVVGRAAWLAVSDGAWRWLVDGAITHVFKIADLAGPGTGAIRLRDGPEISIDVTRALDSGNIDARSVTSFNLESAATWRGFYLQGGYFHYGIRRRAALPDPSFEGWYAQGSWILTGEQRGYNADTASFRPPTPGMPAGEGGFGAFELTSRYSLVDLNASAAGISGGRQTVLALGLNWYANRELRFSLLYDDFRITHPIAPARDFSADALVLRAQYAM
jgi:phosphate-selective porin OprO/OprP